MGGLSIGELARKTGVNIETIRYFEKIGMLGAPERTAGVTGCSTMVTFAHSNSSSGRAN